MRLGVFYPPHLPFSFQTYATNVIKHLMAAGTEVLYFEDASQIDELACDLLWHPFLSGLWFPEAFWDDRPESIVVTVHGVRPFVYQEPDLSEEQKQQLAEGKKQLIQRWQVFKHRIKKLITVSDLAVSQISSVYDIDHHLFSRIYHGVDHETFKYDPSIVRKREFLSMSQYQQVKNIDQLIKAFRRLKTSSSLRLHLPGFDKVVEDSNIFLHTEGVRTEELSILFQQAQCFVFPTLHESFGLPILEAMSCGCPVITSVHTGTAEVADDAALLIDPTDIDSLTDAMRQMDQDNGLRQHYSVKGRERARQFTWEKSAHMHAEVFRNALRSL